MSVMLHAASGPAEAACCQCDRKPPGHKNPLNPKEISNFRSISKGHAAKHERDTAQVFDVTSHRVLLVDLREQRAANQPRPDQAHRQRQRGQVEAAVHGTQRALRILLVYQHRDVVLAAALRD